MIVVDSIIMRNSLSKSIGENGQPNSNSRAHPQSRGKIYHAFRLLLEQKGFNAITTAEIAETAGVNEALIFRYFENKRGLLYQVLADDMEAFQSEIQADLKGIKGAGNKLRKLIWSQINYLDKNRAFARMLLLEITNFPDFFESESFEFIRAYNRIVLELIKEGIQSGEISDNIDPVLIMNLILGGIHYLCLPSVANIKEMEVDTLANDLFETILSGIVPGKN